MQDGVYFKHLRTDIVKDKTGKVVKNGVDKNGDPLPKRGEMIGGITFAVQVDTEKRWVQFSYALCNPKDQFSRKKGRLIAKSRLECPKGRRVSGFELKDAKLSTIFELVILYFWEGYYANRDWVIKPSWLRKLAGNREQTMIQNAINRGLDALKESLDGTGGDVPRAEERPADTPQTHP